MNDDLINAKKNYSLKILLNIVRNILVEVTIVVMMNCTVNQENLVM